MSAAIIIGGIAILKVFLEVASVVATKQQEEREAAMRAPVPVKSAGALPGEALAPLPTSQPLTAASSTSSIHTPATPPISAMSIDPKDLFDPAEFLVVAQRRQTPQHDLFDRSPPPPPLKNDVTVPDEVDDWMTSDGVDLRVEDEIYLQSAMDDTFMDDTFDTMSS